MKLNKQWLLVVAAFVIISLVLLGIGFLKGDQGLEGEMGVITEVSPPASASPTEGQQSPDFTFKHGNQDIQLSDYQGKVVFLNFWASWCPPCKQEMPYIQNIYEKYGDDVIILAVNIQENETTANNFMENDGYNFPVILDQEGQLARSYRVTGIPTSYFLDAEGIIRVQHTGTLTQQMIEDFLDKARNK